MDEQVSATKKTGRTNAAPAPAQRMPPPFLKRQAKQPPRTELGRVNLSTEQTAQEGPVRRGTTRQPARYRFWLQGLGPKGFYTAARSATFEYPTNATLQEQMSGEALNTFNEFMAQLWEEGWAPAAFAAGRLSPWYQITMRRVVTTARSNPTASKDDSGPLVDRKADWYPDPTDRFEQRYWDGEAWTEHVNSRGVTAVDPYRQEGEA